MTDAIPDEIMGVPVDRVFFATLEALQIEASYFTCDYCNDSAEDATYRSNDD